jgi:hypothetical protein
MRGIRSRETLVDLLLASSGSFASLVLFAFRVTRFG